MTCSKLTLKTLCPVVCRAVLILMPLLFGIGYLQSLRSYWLHDYALQEAQTMIILTMFGSILLWGRRAESWSRWRNAHLVVFGWTAMALAGAWLSGQSGLFQRVLLAGWYGWLWIVFREIERQRKLRVCLQGPAGLAPGIVFPVGETG